MDVIATTTTIVSDLDSRQPEIEDPTRIHPAKPISISFSNGKRCHHNHRPAFEAVATYKECLKNHAAGIGGHALDGCGEFMPSPLFNPNEPTSLTCAACGCHRNFHRREEDRLPTSVSAMVPTMEFRPNNRHQLPPPLPPVDDGDDSASPPPISSSYMLLALSGGGGTAVATSRKRFRTKFSQFQKEKMFEFSERVGWRMPKDDVVVRDFCREIGVDKSVFKVWMHNNKISGRGGARRSNGGGGVGDSRESGPTNGSFSSTC